MLHRSPSAFLTEQVMMDDQRRLSGLLIIVRNLVNLFLCMHVALLLGIHFV
jgi:hypothetical protein